jgi:hypothetical protein
MGRGLGALSDTGRCEVSARTREQIWTVEAGSGVSEEQMRALYGEGLHPNADRIMAYTSGRGGRPREQLTASRLGRKFLVRDGEPEFARRLAVAYRDHNAKPASTGTPPSPPKSRPHPPVWP